MKRALSLLCVILCISLLLVGCGGNTPAASTDSSNVVLPGVDASTVSGSVGGDIGGELDNSDIIESTVSQGATTTTAGGQGGNNVVTTTITAKTYKTYSYAEWPMPQRELESKKLTRFVWSSVDEDRLKFYDYIEQAYGIEWTQIGSDFDGYWDNLAKLIAADKSPDLVLITDYNYYPRAVTKNLVQPLDDIIDFNDPFWDNSRTALEKVKWKDKYYFPVDGTVINDLFFYNKEMFADFGLDKTPKDYLLEGNWTWDTFVELANKFVTFEADGTTVKTGGFSSGPDAMHVTTGVDLVEYDAKVGYKLNLKDPKLARYWNMMHDLGLAGSKTWIWPDYWYDAFDKGIIAMMVSPTHTYTWANNLSDSTRKKTDVVPLPLMEKGGTYYWQVQYRLSHSIPTGAKNIEGATLVIEFWHWAKLGFNELEILPVEDNAFMKKFGYKMNTESKLTKAQINWLKEMMETYKGERIDMLWQSWKGDGYTRIDCEHEIHRGESWASSLAKMYPKWNASIKLHFKK